jgi:hypothetical protein
VVDYVDQLLAATVLNYLSTFLPHTCWFHEAKITDVLLLAGWVPCCQALTNAASSDLGDLQVGNTGVAQLSGIF